MATEWKKPLEWANAGSEPSETLKSEGFKAGYKPPADVFNYFLNNTEKCIEQLQEKVDETEKSLGGKSDSTHKHNANDVGAISASSEILSSVSITDAAIAQANSTVKNYALSGDSYKGDDLPSNGYKYGSATVFKRYGFIAIVLWGAPNAPRIATKYYNDTYAEWSDWVIENEIDYTDIGAAPAGFGLGETAKDISNKNLMTEVVGKSGFYRGINVANAPNQYWWCFVVASGTDTTDVICFGANSSIRTARFSNSDTSIVWNEFSLSSHSHTANSLGVPTLLTGTAIGENEDLDDYTSVGNYFCGQSSTAGSLVNCPTYNAFTMKVFYANGGKYYIAQEIIDYASGVRYYRLYAESNGTWQPWYATYSTSNKPKASDIGAGTFPTTEIKAQTGTDYTIGRVRNIWATTNDQTAGSSSLANGNICLVYE